MPFLQTNTFIEGFKRVVPDKGNAIDLNVVDLGTKLYTLVLLSMNNGAQVWAIDADNAVLHILLLHQVLQLTSNLVYSSYTLTLLSIQTYRGSVLAA